MGVMSCGFVIDERKVACLVMTFAQGVVALSARIDVSPLTAQNPKSDVGQDTNAINESQRGTAEDE
jgi:hypothetical protein